MKLGARMIKTGIAITMSLYVAILLGVEPPTYAAIAAIAAIQPSIYESYQSVISNLRGSLIGAIMAVIFYYMIGSSPFVIGLVVVVVMAIQMRFKTQTTITLPAVTVIAIMAGSPSGTDHFLFYAFKRFSLALIGVGSSFVVNFVFLPPKFEKRLINQMTQNSEEMIQSIRLMARRESDYNVLKSDIENFRDNRHAAEDLYQLYKNERTYLRRNRYTKARKLVIFRKMIHTNQMSLDVLKNLLRHEHEFKKAPQHLQQNIQDQLEYLCDYHERIFLTFSGRTRQNLSTELKDKVSEKRQSLSAAFTSFYEQDKENYQQWLYLFPVVAIIIDYHEHLIQLDKRINQFQTYYQKDDHHFNK